MVRYALYALPAPGSALDGFGRAVLGYDSATGADVPRPPGLEDLASVTATARVYGFHATLRPPMRLAPGVGEAEAVAAVERLAADHPPVPVGDLAAAALGPFLALVPTAPPLALGLFAAECVAALDPLRAPLSEAERARRGPGALDPRGRALLDRWGYPHVFERFRFHMTLTDALPEAELPAWRARLAAAYAASGPEPLTLDAVCLLRQEGSAPFRLVARIPLGGREGRAPSGPAAAAPRARVRTAGDPAGEAGTAFVIENAALVLPDRVQRGWLAVAGGRIAEIGEGRAPERGLDLAGDHLIPGLVELHTDHLESHYAPRPGVRWHPLGAVLAYDAQIAASGITTVFDSLRAGSDPDGSGLGPELDALAGAIDAARRAGLLRAEHRTHLRCELPSEDVIPTVEAYCARRPVDLISLMDHTPGQRQFRRMDAYEAYATRGGRSLDAVRAAAPRKIAEGTARSARNRPALVALARSRGIALASHDDTTAADVALASAEGVAIAEFPTTGEAAAAAHGAGLTVMMGAPNLLRGGSHAGNVAALALARAGHLDALSSDYAPGSLVMAAFLLPERVPGIDLPRALATVTGNPARAAGLSDRGALVPGLRADLAWVRLAAGVPAVRAVWRAGARVA